MKEKNKISEIRENIGLIIILIVGVFLVVFGFYKAITKEKNNIDNHDNMSSTEENISNISEDTSNISNTEENISNIKEDTSNIKEDTSNILMLKNKEILTYVMGRIYWPNDSSMKLKYDYNYLSEFKYKYFIMFESLTNDNSMRDKIQIGESQEAKGIKMEYIKDYYSSLFSDDINKKLIEDNFKISYDRFIACAGETKFSREQYDNSDFTFADIDQFGCITTLVNDDVLLSTDTVTGWEFSYFLNKTSETNEGDIYTVTYDYYLYNCVEENCTLYSEQFDKYVENSLVNQTGNYPSDLKFAKITIKYKKISNTKSDIMSFIINKY